ncbi:response regulator transcription factor [Bacillus sp. 1NLA3E]|uniref:response regulator transcription factor n=1 Tax=Bacillus sp. 1NLA3E TaxID=666686 RepID=UPI000247ED6A|nr:response regulator transcription factor [Bacillus sp. 1NLA3E]AGK55649.1 two-component response regulator, CheY-like protein [Bacillus sp. 1NLA3E]
MEKVLIVDDEIQMRKLIEIYLQDHYLIEEAENGEEAYQNVLKDQYGLVILDVMMPKMDGWDTLKKIRGISNVPIIMLTAKGTVQDKVTGLSTGADDYLVKPFDGAELIVRVQALLRRANSHVEEEKLLKYKGISIDIGARVVKYDGQIINLTQTEFDILESFINHKGKVLTREQLVESVWGIEFMGEDRTVDSHIKNLREKLKASGVDKSFIKTVWGVGYKVE